MRNKVYILGAGCSAKYGYPLAKDVISQLESYGKSLDDNTTQLKQCIQKTVELMRTENVKTIDDLTDKLHAGAFDNVSGPTTSQHREEQIWHAKIAMTALLLSKEASVRKNSLEGYFELLDESCPGSGRWQQRLRRSSCSVLTFNYDRLFEIAFLQKNGPDLDGKLLYGDYYLNSGFKEIFDSDIGFADDGFCFLKLHGCVGRWANLDDVVPTYPLLYGHINPGKDIEINDSRFFSSSQALPRMRRHPLIVFPHEKKHVQGGGRHFTYEKYLTAVWQQAEKLIAKADDIWIIGYSFQTMDKNSIINLLLKATKCERVIIQNLDGEAERICHEMPLKHPELKLKWQPFKRAF